MNKEDVAITQYFNEYRKGARRRKYKFEVSREEFGKMVRRKCYICKSPPSNKVFSSKKTHYAMVNGIDRLDSDRGYVAGNIKACCSVCNFMKRNMSLREFKTHIVRIVRGIIGV